MKYLDFYQNNCRICLERPEVALDWNEEIFDFCGMTYRDCYYRYTQMADIVTDNFSQMLCQNCSTDLKKFHFLIERALESHKVLQDAFEKTYLPCIEEKTEQNDEQIATSSSPAISIIEAKDEISYEIEEFATGSSPATSMIEVKDKISYEVEQLARKKDDISFEIAQLDQEEFKSTFNESEDTLIEVDDAGDEVLQMSDVIDTPVDLLYEHYNDSQSSLEEETNKKRQKRNGVMCSYCSKILYNISYLKKHEETHKEHRERRETCPQCGLKLYDKKSMYSHLLVHKKDREKKFKCEFCDKAFFSRGSCNVHRRMHLGQMIPCTLCPKQFCRQIDLDKHMPSHSASALHAEVKTTKYFVHCKTCDQHIPSNSWKSHQAVHLNEPLMKCSLCDKDFFSRKSCIKHISNVHRKPRDEYEQVIIYYGGVKPETRLSHLMLEQQEKVQTI